jgi:hypothetical protein
MADAWFGAKLLYYVDNVRVIAWATMSFGTRHRLYHSLSNLNAKLEVPRSAFKAPMTSKGGLVSNGWKALV